MAGSVLMAEVSGGRVRGRLRFGWMDGVKVPLGNRGTTVEVACQCAKDRKKWRALWTDFQRYLPIRISTKWDFTTTGALEDKIIFY